MFPGRAPWEAAARSGGVPGDSGGFGGARIRSCPFRSPVATAGVEDLIKTPHAENDVVTFLCFDFPVQGLQHFVFRQISTVT